jgi:hypothetical protein
MTRRIPDPRLGVLLATLGWALLLGAFFANVEIQIEGGSGWAESLPTWRIEHHWLLDIFWGGRPMTGYHVWVFSFMALFFHFPAVFAARWNLRVESRILACISLFWVSEDFLWFVFNPAFGVVRFGPAFVPWHPHWWWVAPPDYWIGLVACAAFGWFSLTSARSDDIPGSASSRSPPPSGSTG